MAASNTTNQKTLCKEPFTIFNRVRITRQQNCLLVLQNPVDTMSYPMYPKFSFTRLSMILVLPLLVTACGGSSSSSSAEKTSLRISLTDAPVDSAEAVCITITGIELNLDDGGWVEYPFEISDPSVKCDEATDHLNLLTLTEGSTIELLDEDVEAGTYKVRLVLADNDGEGQFEHYIVV